MSAHTRPVETRVNNGKRLQTLAVSAAVAVAVRREQLFSWYTHTSTSISNIKSVNRRAAEYIGLSSAAFKVSVGFR